MPCPTLEYPNRVSISAADVQPYPYFAVPVDAKHRLFHFSGIICHDFKGGDGVWNRYDAQVTLPRQGFEWVATNAVDPSRSRVAIERGGVSVHLASISNRNAAVNAGWAVDRSTTGTFGGSLTLEVWVAVRDIDGYIHRLGYQAQILARTSI